MFNILFPQLSPAFFPVCPMGGADWDSWRWVAVSNLAQKQCMEWNHCTDLVPKNIDDLCADSWIHGWHTLGANTWYLKNVPVCPSFPYYSNVRCGFFLSSSLLCHHIHLCKGLGVQGHVSLGLKDTDSSWRIYVFLKSHWLRGMTSHNLVTSKAMSFFPNGGISYILM